jgi:hypothetical protein
MRLIVSLAITAAAFAASPALGQNNDTDANNTAATTIAAADNSATTAAPEAANAPEAAPVADTSAAPAPAAPVSGGSSFPWGVLGLLGLVGLLGSRKGAS